jgi:hypothetical protein
MQRVAHARRWPWPPVSCAQLLPTAVCLFRVLCHRPLTRCTGGYEAYALQLESELVPDTFALLYDDQGAERAFIVRVQHGWYQLQRELVLNGMMMQGWALTAAACARRCQHGLQQPRWGIDRPACRGVHGCWPEHAAPAAARLRQGAFTLQSALS